MDGAVKTSEVRKPLELFRARDEYVTFPRHRPNNIDAVSHQTSFLLKERVMKGMLGV